MHPNLACGQSVARWTAILDRDLGSRSINRLVALVAHYAQSAAAAIVYTPVGDHHRSIDRLLVLLRRLQMDQTGWDFVGVVLLLTLVTLTDTRSYLTPIHNYNALISAICNLSDCILARLIHLDPCAMVLTWSRMVALACEWARTGRVCGVPFAPLARGWQTLDQFLVRTTAFHAALMWNGPIERAMLQEAHSAQNELTRPSCPLGADTIGLIAQFLAPPGTSQTALQAQRAAYAAAVKAARLRLAAEQARRDAYALTQARLDKDRLDHTKRKRQRL